MALYLLMLVVGLIVLVGSIAGWVAFFRLEAMQRRIKELELRVAQSRVVETRPSETEQNIPFDAQSFNEAELVGVDRSDSNKPEQNVHDLNEANQWQEESFAEEQWNASNTESGLALSNIWRLFCHHWMIWLGGTCVGLAGIFLVKYSIDAGVLGPVGRITFSAIIGIGLHLLTEWLRRRKGGGQPVFAALAGGASITLFATVLGALHLYQFVSPEIAFVLLAMVAMATSFLALLHGPVLAGLGMIGAYVVPLMVSSDDGHILTVLGYALLITFSLLWLLRYVYRTWLWLGLLVGAFSWWGVSLFYTDADSIRSLYLSILAFLLIAVPGFGIQLKGIDAQISEKVTGLSPMQAEAVLTFTLVAQTLSWWLSPLSEWQLAGFLLMSVLVLAVGREQQKGPVNLWIWQGAQILAWLGSSLQWQGGGAELFFLQPSAVPLFALYALGQVILNSVVVSASAKHHQNLDHVRAALIYLSFPLWLAVAYLLLQNLYHSIAWSTVCLLLGVIYGARLHAWEQRQNNRLSMVWLTIGMHGFYSLAVAMYFTEASLTLALSVQLISIAWLLRRYREDALAKFLKTVLTLVVVRLTLNPWLLEYPQGIHWSLWTYGGAAICAFVASRLLKEVPNSRAWMEVGSLHLLVLFLMAESRYWLYDGNIYASEFTLVEAAFNTCFLGALGLIYWLRGHISKHLSGLYRWCSFVLSSLALVCYLSALTWLNPLWSESLVGTLPIWNVILPAYGLPVVLMVLYATSYPVSIRKPIMFGAGIGFFIWINLEIRHLWQQRLSFSDMTSSGELYTYSLVWLAMAVTALLLSSRFNVKSLHYAGMATLLLVVGKLFLVDMSDLEGLFRVASFMGLGLSLLALAYLYKRVERRWE